MVFVVTNITQELSRKYNNHKKKIKSKRIRQNKCGHCGEIGHNKQTCPHLMNHCNHNHIKICDINSLLKNKKQTFNSEVNYANTIINNYTNTQELLTNQLEINKFSIKKFLEKTETESIHITLLF